MSLGPLASALLAMTCLIGCAAHAPESQVVPLPAPAVRAPESRTVATHRPDTAPEPVDVAIPAAEYPREALAANFEGQVVLMILIDENGRVRQAKVRKDPGHGLGAAAARSALAHFRFSPARMHRTPVATWWVFTVRYELPRW